MVQLCAKSPPSGPPHAAKMLRSRALCRLLRSLPSGCSGSAGEGLLGQFPTHLACVSSDEGPSTSYASSNSSAAGWAAVSGRRWLSAGMPQGFAAAQATKDSSSAPSESSPASSASGLPGPGPISSKPRFYKTVKVLPAPEGQVRDGQGGCGCMLLECLDQPWLWSSSNSSCKQDCVCLQGSSGGPQRRQACALRFTITNLENMCRAGCCI